MSVISVQSQVVYGHVGNSAAVFPLQARGLAVAAVPTVLLSNQPGYPTLRGKALEPELVADLLKGVEERGCVTEARVLITGYLGSLEVGAVVEDFVRRAKNLNPALLYLCDPVIGDEGPGTYVKPGLPELFRDRLIPLSDIITPNRYELEWFAGGPVRTLARVKEAAQALRANGARQIVATSMVLEDTPDGHVETVVCGTDQLHRTAVPLLPIRPSGTGDLLAALLVAGLCRDLPLPQAAEAATRGVFKVVQRTHDKGLRELDLYGDPAFTV